MAFYRYKMLPNSELNLKASSSDTARKTALELASLNGCQFCNINFFFTAVVTICLLLLLITPPVLHTNFYHVRGNVTVGKANGNLFIGTLGYCYQPEGSKNTTVTCSSTKVPYTIDIPQIFAQVKYASTITRALSIVNIMSIVAASLTCLSTFLPCPGCGLVFFAAIASISSLIGVVIDGIIYADATSPKKMGAGFYISLGAAVILGLLVVGQCCVISKLRPKAEGNLEEAGKSQDTLVDSGSKETSGLEQIIDTASEGEYKMAGEPLNLTIPSDKKLEGPKGDRGGCVVC